MVHPTMACTSKAESTVTDASPGPISRPTPVNSWTTTSKDMESTIGQTVASTRACGETTKWKAKVSSSGPTAESTRATTWTTKRKVTVLSTGLMDAAMRVNG